MLTIDELSITLPAGFEGRARRIARLVADSLADIPMTEDRTISHLAIPAVEIHGGATDAQVAARVAGAIRTQIQRPT